MSHVIRRNLMLKDLDVRLDAAGKVRVCSVAFILKNGQRVFFPRAIATGLRMNVKEQRMRGIQPVDDKGNAEGHIYPVGIDNFVEYNGMEILL